MTSRTALVARAAATPAGVRDPALESCVMRFHAHLLDGGADYSLRTVDQYVAGLRKLHVIVSEQLGEPADLERLTVRNVTQARESVLSKGGSPSTANWLVSAAKSWAECIGRSEEFRRVKSIRSGWHPGNALNRAEYNRLIRAIESGLSSSASGEAGTYRAPATILRDRVAISLLGGAALRREEATDVLVGDVKLSGKVGWVEVRSGKGGKSRTAPLPRPEHEYIQRHIDALTAGSGLDRDGARRLQLLARANDSNDSPVKTISPSGLEKLLRRWGEMANIPKEKRGCHALRRFRALTWRWRDGLPLETVLQYLGHSSIETTRLYTTPMEVDVWPVSAGEGKIELAKVMERD